MRFIGQQGQQINKMMNAEMKVEKQPSEIQQGIENIYCFVDYILERERKREHFKKQTQIIKNIIQKRQAEVQQVRQELNSTQAQAQQILKSCKCEQEKIDEEDKHIEEKIAQEKNKIEELRRLIEEERQEEKVVTQMIEKEEDDCQKFLEQNDEQYKVGLMRQFQKQKRIIVLQENIQFVTSIQSQLSVLLKELQQKQKITSELQQEYFDLEKQKIEEGIHSGEEWPSAKSRLENNIKLVSSNIEISTQSNAYKLVEYFSYVKKNLVLSDEDQDYRQTRYFDLYEELLEKQAKSLKEILSETMKQLQISVKETGEENNAIDSNKENYTNSLNELQEELDNKDGEIEDLMSEVEKMQSKIQDLLLS